MLNKLPTWKVLLVCTFIFAQEIKCFLDIFFCLWNKLPVQEKSFLNFQQRILIRSIKISFNGSLMQFSQQQSSNNFVGTENKWESKFQNCQFEKCFRCKIIYWLVVITIRNEYYNNIVNSEKVAQSSVDDSGRKIIN